MARRMYSLDFKVSAAKLVTEQGRGPKDVATSLGVAPSTLQYWVRRSGTPAASVDLDLGSVPWCRTSGRPGGDPWRLGFGSAKVNGA